MATSDEMAFTRYRVTHTLPMCDEVQPDPNTTDVTPSFSEETLPTDIKLVT